MDSWTLVRFVHLAAITFFVGGQLVVLAAVVPVLSAPGREEEMRAIARRFGVWSAVALAIIIATGAAMASHYELWDDPVLHAKLAVLCLIFVLTGLHIASSRTRVIQIALVASSLAMLWLGVKLTYG